MELQVKRLSSEAILPTKAHATDSGFDLYAADDIYIKPGETVIVPTDIAIKLPEGYEAQVRPRSGITSKTKLRVQLGTIDNDYTGGIGVIVDNISQEKGDHYVTTYDLVSGETVEHPRKGHEYVSTFPVGAYKIRKGDKIAQLVIQSVALPQLVEVDEIATKERGESGFGSSGTR